MGFLDGLGKALTTPPGERRAQLLAEQDRKRLAAGTLVICPACETRHDQFFPHQRVPVCPVCYTHYDGTPPDERQLVRTYGNGDVDKAFHADAVLMAKAGWRVVNTAYGGMGQAKWGTLAGTAVAAASSRKASQLTVIYERE
jgi:hypothetical protein